MSIDFLPAGRALILIPVLVLITTSLSCSSRTSAAPLEIHFKIETDDPGTARKLQFYIHDVELLDERGGAHPVRLVSAPPWQSEQVALVDLAGDVATKRNSTIRGSLDSGPVSTYSGIRFTVGVPFELNHANPLTAAAPLDQGAMFWTWQSGYKFLRADFAAGAQESSFHLGSTGCSSQSALRPPAAPCAQPNRMRVELRGDPLRGIVRLHLAPLLASARMTCTGNYAHDPMCSDAYATTGLQPENGVCSDEYCSQQRLWTLSQ